MHTLTPAQVSLQNSYRFARDVLRMRGEYALFTVGLLIDSGS